MLDSLKSKILHIYNSAIQDLKSPWSIGYILVCLTFVFLITVENEFFGIYFGKSLITNIFIAHFSHFGDVFLFYNVIWFLYFAIFFYLIFDNKKSLVIVLILFALFTPIFSEVIKILIIGNQYVVGNSRGFSGILYAMYGFAFYAIVSLSLQIEYRNTLAKYFTLFLVGIVGLLPLISLPETQVVIDGLVYTIRVDILGHILGFLSGYIVAMVVKIKEFSVPVRSWKFAFIMFLAFCMLHLPRL